MKLFSLKALLKTKLHAPLFRVLILLPSKVVLSILMSFLFIGFYSCTHDRSINVVDVIIDTDGDGVIDSEEVLNGTDKNDPCDPVRNPDYTAYDELNIIWSSADCDNDGINNSDELSNNTNPYFAEGGGTDTDYAIPEFLPKLSELRLFQGDLQNLKLNNAVYEYSMSTPMFTDYSHILRSVAIPKGKQMEYDGEDLLLFPDNTVLAKTFYYLNDERDLTKGKKIIETRLLIKKDGTWNVGNYLWNDEQTEALLDDTAHVVQVDWIDDMGNDKMVNYKVLPKTLCFQCHDKNGNTTPIGPKSRALNFTYNGNNQIQFFIDKGLLNGAPDVSQITVLPNWSDNNLLLEDRARAYLDVNCAHCHQPGGSYNVIFGDMFEFRFETSFENSNISNKKAAIQDRISSQISGYFMPLLGTSTIHTEGVALIDSYIESLE